MPLNLSQALRPKTLDGMVGLDNYKSAIKKYIEQECQQWLFSGSTGTGKTTLAHIVARELRGPDYPTEVLDINCAEFRGVADLRDIVRETEVYPMTGKYRVIILDEAQVLTPEAKSLLLKTLEGEASVNVWILCTMNVKSLDKALRDRCPAHFHLNGLGPAERQELVSRAVNYLGYAGDTAKFLKTLDQAAPSSARDVLSAFERFANGVPASEAVGV
jgi:DNA polymerase-3 subunit gamma/tau